MHWHGEATTGKTKQGCTEVAFLQKSDSRNGTRESTKQLWAACCWMHYLHGMHHLWKRMHISRCHVQISWCTFHKKWWIIRMMLRRFWLTHQWEDLTMRLDVPKENDTCPKLLLWLKDNEENIWMVCPSSHNFWTTWFYSRDCLIDCIWNVLPLLNNFCLFCI